MSVVVPAGWPHARPPSVDDLKVRRCFICMDEDVSVAGVRRTRAQHGFVHPCRCTLVAHEKCLLNWIDTVDATRRQCAQCKEQYVVLRDSRSSSLALRALDAANSVLSLAGKGITIVFLGAAFVATTFGTTVIYGLYVARCTLGRKVCLSILEIPPSLDAFYFLLSTVPTALFSEFLPSYFSACIWSSLSLFLHFNVAFNPTHPRRVSWPPSPRNVVSALPLLSSVYNVGVKWLERRLLGDLPHVYTQRLRGGVPRVDHPPPARARGPDPDDALADGSIEKLMRLFGRCWFSMLVMPPLSGRVGGLLCRAAEYSGSEFARNFLGMNLLRRVQPMVKPASFFAKIQNALTSESLLETALAPLPLAWYDFEPTWWQSLIGLAIVTIGKDALALGYKVLMRRDDNHRTIADRPFEGVDMQSLDLVM